MSGDRVGMLRSALRPRLARALRPGLAAARQLSMPPAAVGRDAAQFDFNELRERSLLRHVISTSTEGDPDSVTAAMDEFWDTYFNSEGTSEWRLRGEALDGAIRARAPQTAMEIGTYCGYTAVRMGRLLPPGGRLVSVEIDPLFAAIATKMVEHAGLRDTVSVEIGSLANRLPALTRKYQLAGTPLDALLLDHDVGA